jgi:hypothetical protein
MLIWAGTGTTTPLRNGMKHPAGSRRSSPLNLAIPFPKMAGDATNQPRSSKMRRMKWAIGAAVLLAGVMNLAARQDEAVNLRGPAPKKGQVVTSTSVFKIKNADVTINFGGMKIEAKQTLTATEQEDVKVLAVKGRQATRVQTRIVKEKIDAVTSLGGQDMDDSKDGELKGQIIISERTGPGKWKHSLVDNEPTDKQKKELDKRVGPENDDDLYPEEKVNPGHTWEVDASALQKVFGGSITDLKGKLKMKFVKIDELDGEKVAVIEAAGKITGVAKEDEGNLDVELDLKGTTWRSLKTGLDVKDKAEGKMRMSGKVEMDGAKVDLTLVGPFTIESTSKLKE